VRLWLQVLFRRDGRVRLLVRLAILMPTGQIIRASNTVHKRVEMGGLGMCQTLSNTLYLQSCITQLGFAAPSDPGVLPTSRGLAVLSFSPSPRAALPEELLPLGHLTCGHVHF